MFLSWCSPMSTNRNCSFRCTWAKVSPEMQTPPGSAIASRRAAMFTPLLVMDNVAEIDAYAVAHLTFCRNAGIALGHHFLDGNRALDRVHDTGELSKDAIAGGVDDVSACLAIIGSITAW